MVVNGVLLSVKGLIDLNIMLNALKSVLTATVCIR
jgi:hypothetical protein